MEKDDGVSKTLEPLLRKLALVPPGYRWAGEENYFNKTKQMRLKCSRIDRGGSSPVVLHDEESFSRLSCTPSPTSSTSRKWTGHENCGNPTPSPPLLSQAVTQGMRRAELEKRNKIHKRYSNIKQTVRNRQEEDHRLGYDRLFSRAPSRDDYPYANPIPRCLLTEENIDNLRDIIVDSARQIEWRMLTPIRPESNYEEKFFDKLIELHRARYKTRLALGYFDHEHLRAPFRYTRHQTFMVQYQTTDGGSRQVGSPSKHLHPSLTALTNMKRRYSARRLSLAIVPKLTIPALTLTDTSDIDASGELIRPELAADLDAAGTSSSSISPGSRESLFSYESFSRFSKKQNTSSQLSWQTDNTEKRSTSGESHATSGDHVEDQLDEIVNQLMMGSRAADDNTGGPKKG